MDVSIKLLPVLEAEPVASPMFSAMREYSIAVSSTATWMKAGVDITCREQA